jgi:hypothetical protein
MNCKLSLQKYAVNEFCSSRSNAIMAHESKKSWYNGRPNPRNPNEYQTNEYGILHRNTFSQIIVDAFGAVRERQNNGIVLVFDEEKIKELKRTYDQQDKAKHRYAAPDYCTESHKNEYNNTLEDKSEGGESSEGYRVCGFIIE